MKDGKKYLTAFLMAVLILIFCVAIADGVFGIRGKVIGDGPDGYTVQTSDKTGLSLFWVSLILIVGIFASKTGVLHQLICYPVYIGGYYLLSAVFGSKMNHYFLKHASTAWLDISIGPDGFEEMLILLFLQYFVYFLWKILYLFFRKNKS